MGVGSSSMALGSGSVRACSIVGKGSGAVVTGAKVSAGMAGGGGGIGGDSAGFVSVGGLGAGFGSGLISEMGCGTDATGGNAGG